VDPVPHNYGLFAAKFVGFVNEMNRVVYFDFEVM
jgi:hypothetical protein